VPVRRLLRQRALVALIVLGSAAVADAQGPPRPLEIQPPVGGADAASEPPPVPQAVLEPVVVSAPPAAASSSEQLIPGRDFELRPQGRPAAILRLVPGFVVSQHQGGGKAAQYFLRGFDADHGTDVGFFLDNMPINFRSHAHGQGYTDLHFMIPETLKQVDVFKGPYWVEYGDFSTAAAVNFITRDSVPEDVVEAAGGSWGTQRYLTLFSPTRDRVKTLFAVEIYKTNGPFDRPQDYQRINGFAKISGSLSESVDASIWGSYLWSNWWASGQIPERAVRDKLIDRFGAIDNSEGGRTQRFNLNGNLEWHVTDNDTARVRAYAQYYQLDLYSNFTFFLNDPVNGDQIGQFDRNRKVAGMNAEYEHRDTVFGMPLTTTAGFQFRLDRPNVTLTHTVDRNLLETTQNVSIFETSYAPFLKFEAQPFPWLRILTGARGDFFYFNVHNNLVEAPDQPQGAARKSLPSAKANFAFGPWAQTELFANIGTGYHSNDARAVVTDPNLPALAPATAWEFGVKSRVLPKVELTFTYWWLNLTSELVFNGDDGTVEPSGASRRQGFEFGLKIRPFDWLTYTGNVTQTTAEFFNGNAVPLAPRVTAFSDLTARFPWGLSASVSMRYIGNRWADDDRFQTARGYTLYEAGARYRYKLSGNTFIDAFVNIENLLNVDWREAQFYNTSRLKGEPIQGVNDINYTPGNPRTVIGGLAIRF
jgi:outer membrane receptor protein involved in Fe transport